MTESLSSEAAPTRASLRMFNALMVSSGFADRDVEEGC